MVTTRSGATEWVVSALLLGSLCWILPTPLRADEPAPPSTPEAPKSAAASRRPRAIVIDDLEGPIEPFKPARPETAQQKSRSEALAWFMSGRRKEAESRFSDAIVDYQTAIKLDPNAVEVYRALVPLAFALEKTDEGLQYAQKAIELDPQDLNILKLLAEQLQERHKIEKAAEYLDRATKSPKMKKDSSTYVLLHLQLAALYFEMRDLQKAADAYAVVLDARRNPEKYNLDLATRSALERERLARYEWMGDIFLASKRAPLAVQAFEEAAKAKENHPGPISFSLAQAYFLAKEYGPALKHLQIYLDAQLQGRGRAPFELLAEILKETHKSTELLARVEELAKKDPRNSTLQYFLADQYIEAGRTKDAEALIRRVLKETGDPEGHVELAVLHRKLNQPEELLDDLAKSLKLLREARDPRARRLERLVAEIQHDVPLVDRLIAVVKKSNAADPKAGGAKPDFFANYLVGRIALQNQKTDAAVELYEKAMDIRSEVAPALAEEVALHLAEAKRYQQAITILKKVLTAPSAQSDQVRPKLLLLLARTQEFAGKTQDSLVSIREAKKLDSEDPELDYWEAWIYSHSHRWDEAIHRYQDLIKKFTAEKDKPDKDRPEKERARFVRLCQFTLSNCYVQKGDVPAGERILEEVLVEQPDDPSVNNDLGYLYTDQGKHLERAEKMIRIAIKAEPKNVAYLDSMGWVLFKLGRYEEARTYLEKAIASPSGSDGTIWDHLGDCYARLKANDKAQDAWRKALKDLQAEPYPDSKLIGHIQKKLLEKGADEKK